MKATLSIGILILLATGSACNKETSKVRPLAPKASSKLEIPSNASVNEVQCNWISYTKGETLNFYKAENDIHDNSKGGGDLNDIIVSADKAELLTTLTLTTDPTTFTEINTQYYNSDARRFKAVTSDGREIAIGIAQENGKKYQYRRCMIWFEGLDEWMDTNDVRLIGKVSTNGDLYIGGDFETKIFFILSKEK